MNNKSPNDPSKRQFLKGLAATTATAVAATFAAPAIAKSKTYEWKMVTTWPKNFPGVGTGADKLAKTIETMSSGQIKVKIYGAGELVPAFEVFDAVSMGTAQLGHGGAYYWKGKIPAAQFFSAVPFGFTAQEMNAWLYFGGGLDLWRELYAPFKVLPFPVGNTGVQMGGWFNKAINSINDLKGLKMRMPGLGGEVIKRAGAVPVTIPGGEIYTALRSGTIDAVEWVGPYNDYAFGLHKAAKYYYYPGWHEPGSALELVINQKAYNELPPALQAVVVAAARAANTEMLAEYSAQNARIYQKLLQLKSIEIRQFPQDVLKKLAQYAKQVVSDVAKADKMAKKVYQSYESFRREIVPYSKVTEQAFMNARNE